MYVVKSCGKRHPCCRVCKPNWNANQRFCHIVTCQKLYFAKGLCRTHYRRGQATSNPLTPPWESLRGRPLSKAHRAKLKANHVGNTGKHLSVETRRRISVAQNPSGFRAASGWARIRVITGWEKRANVVWVQVNGPIPKPGIGKRRDNYVVHHISQVRLDDRITNLKLLTVGEHMRLHQLMRLEAKKGFPQPK